MQSKMVRLFLLCITFFSAAGLNAKCLDRDNFHNDGAQRDFEAVQEFVNSKRTISLYEKEKCLEIHGDVKADVLWRNETHQGIKIRGGIIRNSAELDQALNGIFPPPPQVKQFRQFGSEVEYNLHMEYKGGQDTWGKVHVKFDNTLGIFDPLFHNCDNDPQGIFGSGTCGKLCLRTAYLGWKIMDCDEGKFKINLHVGRNRLFKVFDSRIEFSSQADGIFVEVKRVFDPDWLVYGKWYGFIADERDNYYVWVTEVGTLDFFESKFDIKYSFIDWDTIAINRCKAKPLGSEFRVSQVALAYNFPKVSFCKKARIYGAFLINTAAEPHPITNNQRKNIGWYAGFIMGDVKEKGDWSFDMNYQVVQAQAIPDADVFGIGRGNSLGDRLYAPISEGRGAANYKGWHFEYLLQATKCLFYDVTYDYSWPEDREIGGAHFYSRFEFDVIYKF